MEEDRSEEEEDEEKQEEEKSDERVSEGSPIEIFLSNFGTISNLRSHLEFASKFIPYSVKIELDLEIM